MTIFWIFIATLAWFIVSSLYYSPACMANIWQKAVGVKMDMSKSSGGKLAKLFGITFLLYFIQFFIIGFFLTKFNVHNIYSTIIVSIMFWLLIYCSSVVKWMYEQKNMKGVYISAVEDLIRIIVGSLVMFWMM